MKSFFNHISHTLRKVDILSLTAFLAFVMFSLTLYCAAKPLDGEEELYSGIIRFHVLANSDEDYDQNLKLLVRDCVTVYTSDLLSECTSIDSAKEIISKNSDKILKLAGDCIKNQGYSYDVRLSEGFEIYPRRTYGKYTFPAGSYYSVRLSIGSGKGKNWWCVLFPPLCRAGATEERYDDENELRKIGFTDNEIEIINEEKSTRTEIRCFFLDLINKRK